jgi:Putative peptidoglycan binding domain
VGKIASSVGKGGKNESEDVEAVQTLLNRHAQAGGYSKVKPASEYDKDTLKAILAFQKAIGLKNPDGKVDPGGKTWKALEAKDLPKPDTAKPGKVTGNLSGVQIDIVEFVTAIAAFYGRDIKVTSGKRDAKDQGRVMFDYWTINLKRGEKYTYLMANPKILKELDQLYKDAKEDKKKTAKEADEAKARFMKICADLAPKLSLHVAGKAIDISPKSCMTTAMRAAMRTGMHEITSEPRCWHYDTTGSVPVVNESLKAKWKAP